MLDYLKYKDLLIELVKREIKSRYKQSVLGYAWVIFVPLLNLLVLTLVFSFFIRVPTGNIPYPIFLFTGLIPWTFTANSVVFGTSSLVENYNLITKIKIPSEIFPLATILTKLFDFSLTLIIYFLLLVFFKVSLPSTVIYFPLILAVQILFTLGVTFILSATNVFFRDVENILGVAVTFWLYLTPVLYPQELIPANLVHIFNLNPMMPIIGAYRNIILYGKTPAWPSFIYAAIASVLVFILGFLFFKSRAKYFADVI